MIQMYQMFDSQIALRFYCLRRGFIAQSAEHRTGIAEVIGSNPVGASEFFLGFICNCFKLLHNCEDLFLCYSLSAVHSYDLCHIHITSQIAVNTPAFVYQLQ